MMPVKLLLSLFCMTMILVACTLVQNKQEEQVSQEFEEEPQENAISDQEPLENTPPAEQTDGKEDTKPNDQNLTSQNKNQTSATQAPSSSYGKLDLLNPATIDIQNCQDALKLLQKKNDIPIANILLIEKKCEEEYYFDILIIEEVAVKKELQDHTQEDCAFLQNRVLQLMQESDDKETDFLDDKKDNLKKIGEIQQEDIDEEERKTKIKKQEDEIEDIEDELEDLQEKRTRLKELDNIFRNNC